MDKKEAEEALKAVTGKRVEKKKCMFYLPADLHEEFMEFCAEKDTTASDMVEELIRRFLSAIRKNR